MAHPQSQSPNPGRVRETLTYRICDMPARQRPREEMERLGVAHVSDRVLLAVILRSGVAGMNVMELAGQLLNRYGSLTNLAKASVEELASNRGIRKVKAQVLASTLELAKRLSEEAVGSDCAVRSPGDAVRILGEKVRTLDKEVFWVLLLDAKNRLKAPPLEVSSGLLDASLVHPREVFREAIRSACGNIVLTHNHPSGDATPSAEDLRITRQLVEAGKVVDIKVLDHVIVGKPGSGNCPAYTSLREAGLVDFT